MLCETLVHPWIDDEFFETGSFITCEKGQSVYLLKGGSVRETSSPSNQGKKSIFIKKFYGENFLFHNTDLCLKINLEELKEKISVSEKNISIDEKQNYDSVFSEDFSILQQRIPSTLKKAVLVTRQTYKVDDRISLKKHLFSKAIGRSHGRAYGFWNKDFGIIGSTPEILFEVFDETLYTEALAGTAKVGQELELMESSKDREEHNLVIQDLKEKLTFLNLPPEIGNTEISSFSSIIHLRTLLKSKLQTTPDPISLCKVLSPTAALGGYPQDRSKVFLMGSSYFKLFPDRIFGSVIASNAIDPLGLVMIRNVQWNSDEFFIESGVGLVEASTFEKESEEIRLKRKVVREHFL